LGHKKKFPLVKRTDPKGSEYKKTLAPLANKKGYHTEVSAGAALLQVNSARHAP
jgi:hypothetical protein